MSVNPAEMVAGGLLVFFLPGYVTTKALFPEWRVRRRDGWVRGVEVVTMSVLLSVVLTILAGFVLGALPGQEFEASWSYPLLEAFLGGIAAIAFAVGWMRGAFRKEPPAAPIAEPTPGDAGAWELLRRLEELSRKERRLSRQLRQEEGPGAERTRRDIEAVRREIEELRTAREAEYAG